MSGYALNIESAMLILAYVTIAALVVVFVRARREQVEALRAEMAREDVKAVEARLLTHHRLIPRSVRVNAQQWLAWIEAQQSARTGGLEWVNHPLARGGK